MVKGDGGVIFGKRRYELDRARDYDIKLKCSDRKGADGKNVSSHLSDPQTTIVQVNPYTEQCDDCNCKGVAGGAKNGTRIKIFR